MTAKVSKTKLIAVVCILAAILCVAVVLLKGGGESGGADSAENAVANSDITTNERRIEYLAAYGWEVNADPVETQEVMIPEEMNEVFEKYNELQRSQGFDLSRFAGRQVKRYVYEVTNYEGAAEPVYATLLIYKGSVIGGDVTSTAGDGLMHGFAKPASSAKASPKDPPEETAESAEETAGETTTEETAAGTTAGETAAGTAPEAQADAAASSPDGEAA